MYRRYYSRYADWNYSTTRLSTCPAIYSSAYKFTTLVQQMDEFDYMPLAVAHYTQDPEKKPAIPDCFHSYMIHQFSADGNGLASRFGVTGSSAVDLDVWNTEKFPWIGDFDEPELPPEPVTGLPEKFEAQGKFEIMGEDYICHSYFQKVKP